MQPPQHSATSTPTFVDSAAFDIERVISERATMPDGGDGHPVVLYFAGETRYDLSAPALVGDETRCPRDYLRPDHDRPVWTLRRMRPTEVASCHDIGGQAAKLRAFALSAGERTLTDLEVAAHVDQWGIATIYAVGEAALRASEAPKAAEKKR